MELLCSLKEQIRLNPPPEGYYWRYPLHGQNIARFRRLHQRPMFRQYFGKSLDLMRRICRPTVESTPGLRSQRLAVYYHLKNDFEHIFA